MKDGDHTGLSLFRDKSAYIGVKRDGGKNKVIMVNGIDMDAKWNPIHPGTEKASQDVSQTKIYLRAAADVRPGNGHQAKFSYSTDGSSYRSLGDALSMGSSWEFFIGYRFAVFNFATQALGGSVTVEKFDVATP